MQRDREVRENSGSPFDSFGFHGGMIPSMFGGKDAFDDPFLSRPHGSLIGSETSSFNTGHNPQPTSKSNVPVIKELDSDSEEVLEEGEKDGAAWNRNPLVEHPEDHANDNVKRNNNNNGSRIEVSNNTNYDKAEGAQPQTSTISFQRVTYGGINGAYYTSTTSRRTGSDGVTMEERKQADRTTGQATHKVSRGIHDKGHSVMRKLDSDGKVDTVQTLHNLNEDELAGFEQAWGANAGHFHGWNDSFDFAGNFGTSSSRLDQLVAQGGFPDPFRELFHRNGGSSSQQNLQGHSTGGRGRPKKVVSINIE